MRFDQWSIIIFEKKTYAFHTFYNKPRVPSVFTLNNDNDHLFCIRISSKVIGSGETQEKVEILKEQEEKMTKLQLDLLSAIKSGEEKDLEIFKKGDDIR